MTEQEKESIDYIFSHELSEWFNRKSQPLPEGYLHYIFDLKDYKSWYVSIGPEGLSIREMNPTNTYMVPNVTIKIDPVEFLNIISGKSSLQWAYMVGKVEVVGELSKALLLAQYFPKES